jgi:beta-phosphoglucomutase-like phosphatase (HAD superfamily)
MFRSKGLPMAVASSSDLKIINAVMDKFEISGYFNVIHSAEFEDYGKPHPAIYLTTAKKLGVLPNECLAIEDSLNGLRSAIAAGTKTAAVPDVKFFNNSEFDIADMKLGSLEELNEEKLSELNTL